MQQTTLWKRLRAFRPTTQWLTVQRVGVLLLILALLSGGVGYINQHPEGFTLQSLLGDFYANISTEFASIAITVLIIDTLNRRREMQQQTVQQREIFIRQMGSKMNETAILATEALRGYGWLTDGTMQEQDLRTANLENAKLWKSDLQGVNLQWANLKNANLNDSSLVGANLKQANLQKAGLRGADLRGANLFEAKLYRANLNSAILRDADCTGVHFEGARMEGADMRGATLNDAFFDEKTILPDGNAWTPEADILCFIDHDCPQSWLSSLSQNDDGIDSGDE